MNGIAELLAYSFMVNALVTGLRRCRGLGRQRVFHGMPTGDVRWSCAAEHRVRGRRGRRPPGDRAGVRPVCHHGARRSRDGFACARPSRAGCYGRRHHDVHAGLGVPVPCLYSGYAARVYGILFGSILGISAAAARLSVRRRGIAGGSSRSCTGRSFSARSIPELARARGVPRSFPFRGVSRAARPSSSRLPCSSWARCCCSRSWSGLPLRQRASSRAPGGDCAFRDPGASLCLGRDPCGGA